MRCVCACVCVSVCACVCVCVCVSDHISSGPALLFPVAAITELCHQYNVHVLIDGAHCPAHVPLDISSIGADYYIGECVSVIREYVILFCVLYRVLRCDLVLCT